MEGINPNKSTHLHLGLDSISSVGCGYDDGGKGIESDISSTCRVFAQVLIMELLRGRSYIQDRPPNYPGHPGMSSAVSRWVCHP